MSDTVSNLPIKYFNVGLCIKCFNVGLCIGVCCEPMVEKSNLFLLYAYFVFVHNTVLLSFVMEMLKKQLITFTNVMVLLLTIC